MASISNIPTNARSMNGIIILSDGVCNIEDGNITTDGDIITSNITTNDINLNVGNGRTLSVYDDLNNKAYYTDIITLSGVVYNNYNTILSNENTIYNYAYSISSKVYSNNNSFNNYAINNNLYNST